jgi:hypothetical protein
MGTFIIKLPTANDPDVFQKKLIKREKKINLEVRESKSLCPKEFQQRDIERYELPICYHNSATIVNKYELAYNYTSLLA